MDCTGLTSFENLIYFLLGKLICVGVLDYLTECLSSVYLYFDTAYSNLNLGTYSACVEILLSMRAARPFYYMGYYIHRFNVRVNKQS